VWQASDARHDDVPGCPGLVLDLDELRADVARLAPADTERD
jgi:hypothetical protein